MRTPRLAIAFALLALAACGGREPSSPAPEPTAAPAAATTVEATPLRTEPAAPAADPPTAPNASTPVAPPAVPPATAAPAKATVLPTSAKPKPPTAAKPAVPPESTPAAPVPPAPTAIPSPPPTAPPSAPPIPPAAKASSVVDPGGEVVVAAAKPGPTRVGADKCRVCHKVQHASWATSPHAKRTPPLDCEGCHGAGSEYKALSVMKDPKQARAAGLVLPDSAYCGRCHKGPWDPALLGKAHAHKGP